MRWTRPDMKICKHDEGFFFCYTEDKPEDSLWLCIWCCGYFLNFDPEKFPDGIAVVKSGRHKPGPVFSRGGWS